LLSNTRISVRDKISKRRIEGITGGPVNLTGDSALFVEPAPQGTVQALLEKMGVERGGKIAMICPRALSALNRAHYHDHITHLQIESIRLGLTRAADKLSEAGYTIVFLPMHITPTDNDLAEIGSIRGSMIMPSLFLAKTLEPHAAAAFLGSASIVVGLRLHSLILAASQGVPVVSVGYDEKIRGFMDYAGVGGCVVEPVELANKALVVAARGEELGVVLSGSCSVMRARIKEEASVLVESLS
jgi:polysaccharide pyruvyl transferase WcaK-like protein